ncbi:MAG: AAA family ATPase, partial [Acetobacteraceae bacterium]|nr:AAA family ATPase [Acetobacteraceae bacterium]
SGHAVVLDATFLDPKLRVELAAAAHKIGVPFLGVWLHAPLSVLEARITRRRGDASDATVGVLRRAAAKGSGVVGWLPVDAADLGSALAVIRDAAFARSSYSAGRAYL